MIVSIGLVYGSFIFILVLLSILARKKTKVWLASVLAAGLIWSSLAAIKIPEIYTGHPHEVAALDNLPDKCWVYNILLSRRDGKIYFFVVDREKGPMLYVIPFTDEVAKRMRKALKDKKQAGDDSIMVFTRGKKKKVQDAKEGGQQQDGVGHINVIKKRQLAGKE